MRIWLSRAALVAAAGLWLAGCGGAAQSPLFAKSDGKPADATADAGFGTNPEAPFGRKAAGGDGSLLANAMAPDPEVPPDAAEPRLLGSDPYDSLSLGKKQYLAHNFGLAEQHFRKAVEQHPSDVEAWLGLAASYDRLRRFDLADRAYKQAIGLVGPTATVLNNQGYSYMLRGDYKRAREKLIAAQRKDPGNKFIANNLRLLDQSAREAKGIE
jgi:tetratricopeptide (TPR) repeat protein